MLQNRELGFAVLIPFLKKKGDSASRPMTESNSFVLIPFLKKNGDSFCFFRLILKYRNVLIPFLKKKGDSRQKFGGKTAKSILS